MALGVGAEGEAFANGGPQFVVGRHKREVVGAHVISNVLIKAGFKAPYPVVRVAGIIGSVAGRSATEVMLDAAPSLSPFDNFPLQ